MKRTESRAANEIGMTERREVIIPIESWEAFVAWADAPPREIPELRRLAKRQQDWADIPISR